MEHLRRTYRIVDLVRRLNRDRTTIFRWEAEGKIPKARRDTRGWRYYTPEDFKFITQFVEANLFFRDGQGGIAPRAAPEKSSVLPPSDKPRAAAVSGRKFWSFFACLALISLLPWPSHGAFGLAVEEGGRANIQMRIELPRFRFSGGAGDRSHVPLRDHAFAAMARDVASAAMAAGNASFSSIRSFSDRMRSSADALVGGIARLSTAAFFRLGDLANETPLPDPARRIASVASAIRSLVRSLLFVDEPAASSPIEAGSPSVIPATDAAVPVATIVPAFPPPDGMVGTSEPAPVVREVIREIVREVSPASLESRFSKIITDIANLWSALDGKASFTSLAHSNAIDQLSGVTFVTNGNNSFNLTDADIPDTITAANYLLTSGGTLSGSVSGTSGSFSGSIYASSTLQATGNILGYASLGIGTTSPSHLLTVRGPFLANGTSTIEGAGLIAQSLFSTTSLNFYTTSNAASRLTIDSSGNVGIGTTSPGTLFAVNGPGLFVGTSTIFGGLNLESVSATGTLGFYTRGTAGPRMVIDSSGNVGIATSGPTTTFSTVGSGYFTAGLGAGYATTGAGNIVANDFILSRGRLGVNATGSPTVEFGVTGSGYLTGGLGIGEATTSPGGLLVKGLGVFDQTLLIRGTGTSTFSGGLQGTYLNLTGTSATSTASNGFNLAGGCYAINGACIGGAASGWTPVGTNVVLTTITDFVGIGTATPGAKLSIGGPFLAQGTSTITGGGLITQSIFATGTLNFYTNSNIASRLTIDTAGAVGIGTTSPSHLLTIRGPFLVNGTSTIEGAGLIAQSLFSTTSLNFYTNSNPASRITIDSSGNVGIGTTSPGTLFAVNGPATFVGTSTIFGGLNLESISATGTLGFYTRGTAAPRMVIDSSGNVGIGTTSPVTTFSTVGNGYFTGGVGIGSVDTNAGTLYVSNGNSANPTLRVQQLATGNVQRLLDLDAASTNGTGWNFIEAYSSSRTDAEFVWRGDGTPSSDNAATTPADVAEWTRVIGDPSSYEPGDLMIIASEEDRRAKKAEAGSKQLLIGVVTLKPGLVGVSYDIGMDVTETIGDKDYLQLEKIYNAKMVATLGYTPIKVSTENGALKSGDPITISSTPGVGMKANPGDKIVGYAFESFNPANGKMGTHDIDLPTPIQEKPFRPITKQLPGGKWQGWVFGYVNLGYSKLDSEISGGDVAGGTGWTLDPYSGRITTVFNLDLTGHDIMNVRSVLSQNGSWGIDENGHLTAASITAKKLCLEDVCIEKEQLRTLLQNAGLLQAVAPPPASPPPPPPAADIISSSDTTTPPEGGTSAGETTATPAEPSTAEPTTEATAEAAAETENAPPPPPPGDTSTDGGGTSITPPS